MASAFSAGNGGPYDGRPTSVIPRISSEYVAWEADPRCEWRDVGADDRALLEAVATLTPQRRLVIVLRYRLGYSPADIARAARSSRRAGIRLAG